MKRKVNQKIGQTRALTILHKHGFKKVTRVIDATKALSFEVTANDVKKSTRYNPSNCAGAVATRRQEHLDGALIATSRAYMIKGKTAVRFEVPETISREITSFDRGSGFEIGHYHLAPPSPASRLGVHRGPSRESKPTSHSGNLVKRYRHVTGNIRESLRK